MLQTIEAVTDQDGILRILEPIKLPKLRGVIITILDDEPSDETCPYGTVEQADLSQRLGTF